MSYRLNQPPVMKRFDQMNGEEARSFYDWFIEQIPARIQVLEQAVRDTLGYDGWTADGSPHSLVNLGKWFCQKVTFRGLSEGELDSPLKELPGGIITKKPAAAEFPSETISIALDVAMYLSHALWMAVPDLKWQLNTASRLDVNYHQPVIVGKGAIPFNPFHIVMVYAFGVEDRTAGPNRLRELYQIWLQSLANSESFLGLGRIHRPR